MSDKVRSFMVTVDGDTIIPFVVEMDDHSMYALTDVFIPF
jgi:hypothetical protein